MGSQSTSRKQFRSSLSGIDPHWQHLAFIHTGWYHDRGNQQDWLMEPIYLRSPRQPKRTHLKRNQEGHFRRLQSLSMLTAPPWRYSCLQRLSPDRQVRTALWQVHPAFLLSWYDQVHLALRKLSLKDTTSLVSMVQYQVVTDQRCLHRYCTLRLTERYWR